MIMPIYIYYVITRMIVVIVLRFDKDSNLTHVPASHKNDCVLRKRRLRRVKPSDQIMNKSLSLLVIYSSYK